MGVKTSARAEKRVLVNHAIKSAIKNMKSISVKHTVKSAKNYFYVPKNKIASIAEANSSKADIAIERFTRSQFITSISNSKARNAVFYGLTFAMTTLSYPFVYSSMRIDHLKNHKDMTWKEYKAGDSFLKMFRDFYECNRNPQTRSGY